MHATAEPLLNSSVESPWTFPPILGTSESLLSPPVPTARASVPAEPGMQSKCFPNNGNVAVSGRTENYPSDFHVCMQAKEIESRPDLRTENYDTLPPDRSGHGQDPVSHPEAEAGPAGQIRPKLSLDPTTRTEPRRHHWGRDWADSDPNAGWQPLPLPRRGAAAPRPLSWAAHSAQGRSKGPPGCLASTAFRGLGWENRRQTRTCLVGVETEARPTLRGAVCFRVCLGRKGNLGKPAEQPHSHRC